MTIKRGNEVKETKDMSNAYIKLKDGDSIKVIMLSGEDYIEYPSHGDFEAGIYTQPCQLITNTTCLLCDAKIPKKDRMVFAFYSVETKEVKYLELSKYIGMSLAKQIRNLIQDIEFGTIYTLTRTGNKAQTAYTLSEVAERKLTKDEKDLIKETKSMKVSDDEFMQCIQPKSESYINKVLTDVETKNVTGDTADVTTDDLPF
jgi:hypothetical protein